MRELSWDETQRVSLEILVKVAGLCDKLNLRYYLMWGTLIGAVRHKGYIPWDDDVDIAMPRKDYTLLINYMMEHQEEMLPYQLFSVYNRDDYFYSIARISDSRTYQKRTIDNPVNRCEMGIFIDIYPIDNAGNNMDEVRKFLKIQSKIYFMKKLAHMEKYSSPKGALLYRLAYFLTYVIAKVMGENNLNKILDKNAERKLKRDTEYVCVWAGSTMQEDIVFKRKWFNDFVESPFEQYSFKIPVDYDEILRVTYGDYMKLPPEEERVGHHNYIPYSLLE